MGWKRLILTLSLVATVALWGCSKPMETTNAPPPPETPPGAAGVIGQSAANAALKAQVKTALVATKGLDTAHLDVEAAADGTVTLTGGVHSEVEKALAEKTARGVAGVRKVTNKLEIVPGH